MAYAMMVVVNQQVQYAPMGQADQNPATVTTMLNNAPANDGVAHLFEYVTNDQTGAVMSATMDKSPLTVT